MITDKLSVNGKQRHTFALHYEYFHPIDKSEGRYLEYLRNYFPYDEADRNNLSRFDYQGGSFLRKNSLDKRLEEEARDMARHMNALYHRNRKEYEKELYYDYLKRLRYAKGLDRLIIPNVDNLYSQEVLSEELPGYPLSSRMLGGYFRLWFESTDHDDFFYQWLRSGEMNQGEFQIFRGDSDSGICIRFWDCYCVEISERMCATSYEPMLMSLYLSPAIVENRGLKIEKSWKVTEVTRQPFKAEALCMFRWLILSRDRRLSFTLKFSMMKDVNVQIIQEQ